MTTRKSPVPRPGPTDVVVRVEAVAVDPADLFVGSGRYDPPLPFPFVVGGDVVGTVTACGPGLAGLSPGEPVWSNSLGHAGRQGPSVELAVVPVDRLHHLPDPADPLAAVAVLHPAASAFLALLTHGKLRSGETVLVAGGASHVGQAAIVIAVHAGARALATAAAADLDECHRLGAEAAFEYRDPDLAGTLRDAAGSEVDVHLQPRVTTTSTWRPISLLAGGASC